MEINEIEVGTKWNDCLGKAIYSKKGNLQKGILERVVEITNKTTNSIEYKDDGGFISWISFDDFTRIENSTKIMRFNKV